MKNNSDIKIFPCSVRNRDLISLLLKDIGYTICDNMYDAQYILIDDLSDEFDINFYRSELKHALDNDKVISILSKGLPYFVTQYEGEIYFGTLYLNITLASDHWHVTLPSCEKIQRLAAIFPKRLEPKTYVEVTDPNKIGVRDDRWKKYKGLFF